MSRSRFIVFTTLVAAMTFARDGRAQPVPPPQGAEPQPPPEGLQPEPPQPKPPPEGFRVESADGEHSLRFGAVVHADQRFLLEGKGTDTFLIRRARPILEAKIFDYYEFRFQADFAGTQPQLLDAYGNLHFIDEVQLRVGKGKTPVGLERLQSPADITFADRALPTLLVPNRDIGVQLHGKALKERVEWAVGVYNGVPNGGSGVTDSNNEKDIAGRIFLRPFIDVGLDPLEGFGIGVAALTGTESGALPSYTTTAQQTFFDYFDPQGDPGDPTASADGRRWLISPQGYFYYGPVGLLGEYVHVSEAVQGAAGRRDVVSRAWQIAGSVVLFGGKPSYKGVKVDTPLDPENGSYGALELAARFHELGVTGAFAIGSADPGASARHAQAWGVAANYYFFTRVRANATFERTTFGGVQGQDPIQTESVLTTRLQVAF